MSPKSQKKWIPLSELTANDLIYGDIDKDNIPNLDDPHPMAYHKDEKQTNETSITNEFRIMRNATRSVTKGLYHVIGEIRKKKILPRGAILTHRSKNLYSLVNKLRRYSLQDCEDLGGGRIILNSEADLRKVSDKMQKLFPNADVENYYNTPKAGYKAVHFNIPIDQQNKGYPKRIEIQLKTARIADITEKYHKFYKTDTSSKLGKDRFSEAVDLAARADKGDINAQQKFNEIRKNFSDNYFK